MLVVDSGLLFLPETQMLVESKKVTKEMSCKPVCGEA